MIHTRVYPAPVKLSLMLSDPPPSFPYSVHLSLSITYCFSTYSLVLLYPDGVPFLSTEEQTERQDIVFRLSSSTSSFLCLANRPNRSGSNRRYSWTEVVPATVIKSRDLCFKLWERTRDHRKYMNKFIL